MFPVPNKPDGFCGHKATLKRIHKHATFYKTLNSIHLLLSRQHVVVNTIISNNDHFCVSCEGKKVKKTVFVFTGHPKLKHNFK